MIFEGDQDFSQQTLDLWTRLRDMRFLVHCIPDATPGAAAEPARASCTVRPGFSFVRGSLEVTLERIDAVEGRTLRVLATSKGIGSSNEVETLLGFAGHEGGTRVHWKAEVKHLGGLLKAVPTGLIRGAAQKVIADVWASVAEKINVP